MSLLKRYHHTLFILLSAALAAAILVRKFR